MIRFIWKIYIMMKNLDERHYFDFEFRPSLILYFILLC